MSNSRLRVLFVPDSVHWVTGTIAKSIARFNPWIEATVASGPVIDVLFEEQPDLMRNFDLVHFVCPYASREWLPRFRELVPCVTSHHHVTDWELIKHNLEGDAIIVGSPEWAEDLLGRGADPKKVFYVPYGVDVEQFRPATEGERAAVRAKLRIPSGARVIGFFGKNSSNDDDRKGIDVFTEALLRLRQRMPDLTVLIVGPGWKELVGSFRAAGLRCVWLPFISELAGLAEMYHVLDFYWITARVEGGPVTLLEAMSSEVCCLTTPVGLAREIVRDGENALLMPFNDAQAFVERTAALAVATGERKRLGENARKTILAEMHAGVTTQRISDVYTNALAVFAQRQQPSARRDVSQFTAKASANNQPESNANIIPLSGFPDSIHRRAQMLESLAWAEHLVLYHRQRVVALKLITKEWLHNPLSPLPARVLLRRFLPVAFVGRFVKLKNRSRKPRLIANYSPTEKV
jgi:glycosyltransferase involved in cell wall biosynthesis